jgi:hypothetical protein
MSPLQCLFCDQTNPPAAKFCNECGTPLHFKPCPQCDGINGRFAGSCYRCGAAFSMVAGEDDAVLSPLHDAAGPVVSLAATAERLGAANEARAAEASPNDDEIDRPAARRVGSWPLAAGAGVLAIALPILAIVGLNSDRGRGNDADGVDGAPTLAAAPSAAVVDEIVGPPAPPAPSALPVTVAESTVAPGASKASASPTRAATARKHSQAKSRVAGARQGAPTRVSTSKQKTRTAKATQRTSAPAAAGVSKPQPTRHSETVQIAVRAEETSPARDDSAAGPGPFAMAWLTCAEGRMLDGACDVRLLAKGN